MFDWLAAITHQRGFATTPTQTFPDFGVCICGKLRQLPLVNQLKQAVYLVAVNQSQDDLIQKRPHLHVAPPNICPHAFLDTKLLSLPLR